ncbi:transposase [Mycobacteroides chelonae]|uniref:transposase n=1 Tax=Mycobacteroides chelonae TaxID=1774 RepID=UPI0019108639|nr:transposase [Mycobacteroides chelonae]QQG99541.1 transposase [Mycobacteroides chelonae]
MGVDWSKRGEYIAKHGTTPAQADEALGDPECVVLDPDPASKSGASRRVIGYSTTAQAVIAVILTDFEGVTYGVNAWEASDRDKRLYRQGGGI